MLSINYTACALPVGEKEFGDAFYHRGISGECLQEA